MGPGVRTDRGLPFGARRRYTVQLALGCLTTLLLGACASAPPPRPQMDPSPPARPRPASRRCSAHAALLCGPLLNVDVQARLWPHDSRELLVNLSLSEGGYLSALRDGDGALAVVRVQQHDPGVTLGPARAQPTDSAQHAALALPIEIDEQLCRRHCGAWLQVVTRVCREPGLCHEVIRPVRVELTPDASPARLSFHWH